MKKRLNCHISEAFSSKENQCHYLNNCIRKYGVDKFKVELLYICSIDESDKYETYYINKLNSMFPNGLNLKSGQKTPHLCEEAKKRVSNGVYEYYKDKKFARFDGIEIPEIINYDDYIKPLLRDNNQYGWYVYIKRKKADFGGIHIPLDTSRKRAEDFIQQLRNQYIAKHLDAGNSLES